MQISFTKSSEATVNVSVKGIRLNSVIFCWSLILGIQVTYLGVSQKQKYRLVDLKTHKH